MHGYLFFVWFLASYEHCRFYCSMVLTLLMVFDWGNVWWCWFCIFVLVDFDKKEGASKQGGHTKHLVMWKNKILEIWLLCGFFIFVNCEYEFWVCAFGVRITISIDGEQCPLIENSYDLVKLMNLCCAISFDGGIKSLKIVYRDQNHGCDEKP